MSKPILVTRLPKEVSPDKHRALYDYLIIAVPDYNHIIFRESSTDKTEFEVFNVQDYPQIDFETLKDKLERLNDRTV